MSCHLAVPEFDRKTVWNSLYTSQYFYESVKKIDRIWMRQGCGDAIKGRLVRHKTFSKRKADDLW